MSGIVTALKGISFFGKKISGVGALFAAAETAVYVGMAAWEGDGKKVMAELGTGVGAIAGGAIGFGADELGRQAMVEAIDYTTGVRATDSHVVQIIKAGNAADAAALNTPEAKQAAENFKQALNSKPGSLLEAMKKGTQEARTANTLRKEAGISPFGTETDASAAEPATPANTGTERETAQATTRDVSGVNVAGVRGMTGVEYKKSEPGDPVRPKPRQENEKPEKTLGI